ncbi:MAG: hypothetical protein DWQ02_06220 [Bacteroidetes bacterium]|nr:MAG: hypothetical protein DWQ02_06220 [Bacteroidota bacterium]
MKRFFTIFLAVLFAVTSFAQVPKSYERKIKRQTKKVERLKKEHDIVLDAQESIPLLVSYSTDAQALTNWGIDYLQIKEYRDKISAKEGKRNVLVVEFDTGGELTHPSLLKATLKGFSYTGEPLKDEHGHATHVGGIMASNFSNIGVGQVLIKGGHLKLLPVKILHNEGWGDMPEIITGVADILEYVGTYLDAGWFVIFTNSWGGGPFNAELDALYKKAEEKGIIVIAASGNNGSGTIGNPAASRYVEAVGALQEDGTRAPYSQYGKGLAFVAPGSNIFSTYLNGSFAKLSGTSMAAPHEAAVYALIASYWPDATAAELKAHFRNYAKDLPPEGYDRFNGFGASLIGPLIENEPEKIGEDPDEPDDPIGDTIVIKKERIITLPLEDLDMVWSIGTTKDKRPIKVELVLKITSNRLAELTFDESDDLAHTFFGRYGLLFSDKKADVYDAAEWTARFYHRFANQKQDIYSVGIKQINVTDEQGRTFIRYGEDLKITGQVAFEDIPTLVELK